MTSSKKSRRGRRGKWRRPLKTGEYRYQSKSGKTRITKPLKRSKWLAKKVYDKHARLWKSRMHLYEVQVTLNETPGMPGVSKKAVSTVIVEIYAPPGKSDEELHEMALDRMREHARDSPYDQVKYGIGTLLDKDHHKGQVYYDGIERKGSVKRHDKQTKIFDWVWD
jgi:hypothetical protein